MNAEFLALFRILHAAYFGIIANGMWNWHVLSYVILLYLFKRGWHIANPYQFM